LSSIDVFIEEIADQIALKEKLHNDLEEAKSNISENFGTLIKDTKEEKSN
jgi:hypothetical protein